FPRLEVAVDDHIATTFTFEGLFAALEEGPALVREIPNRVGDPGDVHVGEEVEIVLAGRCELLQKRVHSREESAAPNGREKWIGVTEEHAPCIARERVFTRDLPSRDHDHVLGARLRIERFKPSARVLRNENALE